MHGKYCILLLLFVLVACSEKEEKKQISGQAIYRQHDEIHFTLEPPKQIPLCSYPWEERFKGEHPKITKEFFRCKGSSLHPVVVEMKEGKELRYYQDCGGAAAHGLPLKDGKEHIYICLIEILNYLQEQTGKKVVITSGHRCPTHNTYCDYTNWDSKHMIGAEVDFYIESLQPEKIVQLIMDYYKQHPSFQGKEEYEKFERYEKSKIATPPWYNKEIFIKIYKEEEGRNCDNSHPYPYIGLQVRHDRLTNERVLYDRKAAQNYRRY